MLFVMLSSSGPIGGLSVSVHIDVALITRKVIESRDNCRAVIRDIIRETVAEEIAVPTRCEAVCAS